MTFSPQWMNNRSFLWHFLIYVPLLTLNILHFRLENYFHISGQALTWFNSYLTEMTQRVKINETLSDPVELETGSGWGPQAYSKYVGPLDELLRILQLLYHPFADDTQLLKSLNPNSVDAQVLALQYMYNAISEVSKWMTEK